LYPPALLDVYAFWSELGLNGPPFILPPHPMLVCLL
jgi:hypothetical protein